MYIHVLFVCIQYEIKIIIIITVLYVVTIMSSTCIYTNIKLLKNKYLVTPHFQTSGFLVNGHMKNK